MLYEIAKFVPSFIQYCKTSYKPLEKWKPLEKSFIQSDNYIFIAGSYIKRYYIALPVLK